MVAGLLLVPAAEAKAPPVRLQLPYDLAVHRGAVYVADGERHQILRYDLARKRLTVFAGTGATGTSGDGGPARRARLTEPTEVMFDRAGNLYFTDVNQGRVRRIDPRGRITTLARVRAAAGLSVDPSGRYLAIASIEGAVYRLELASRRLETLADGLNGPHDASYAANGDLYIGGWDDRIGRIRAGSSTVETVFDRGGFKVVPVRDTLYLMAGDPSGGTVTQVDAEGKVLRMIGSGRFMPSDVEPLGAIVLISQIQPVPAIRTLAEGTTRLGTLLRSRG